MSMNHEARDSLKRLQRQFDEFALSRRHDSYVVVCIEEAIAAAEEGNIGVGAVIVGPDGEIIQRGRNRVFLPHFRSDLHAEMDAMNRFEDQFRDVAST